MPSVGEKQRRFFGAVLAYKRGKLKRPSGKLMETAKHLTEKQAREFAGSVSDTLKKAKRKRKKQGFPAP